MFPMACTVIALTKALFSSDAATAMFIATRATQIEHIPTSHIEFEHVSQRLNAARILPFRTIIIKIAIIAVSDFQRFFARYPFPSSTLHWCSTLVTVFTTGMFRSNMHENVRSQYHVLLGILCVHAKIRTHSLVFRSGIPNQLVLGCST